MYRGYDKLPHDTEQISTGMNISEISKHYKISEIENPIVSFNKKIPLFDKKELSREKLLDKNLNRRYFEIKSPISKNIREILFYTFQNKAYYISITYNESSSANLDWEKLILTLNSRLGSNNIKENNSSGKQVTWNSNAEETILSRSKIKWPENSKAVETIIVKFSDKKMNQELKKQEAAQK